MFPEGVAFSLEGRHYRLDSFNKASKFLEKNDQKLGYQEQLQAEFSEEEDKQGTEESKNIKDKKKITQLQKERHNWISPEQELQESSGGEPFQFLITLVIQ